MILLIIIKECLWLFWMHVLSCYLSRQQPTLCRAGELRSIQTAVRCSGMEPARPLIRDGCWVLIKYNESELYWRTQLSVLPRRQTDDQTAPPMNYHREGSGFFFFFLPCMGNCLILHRLSDFLIHKPAADTRPCIIWAAAAPQCIMQQG